MGVTKIESRENIRTPTIIEKGLSGQSTHEYMLMGQRGPGWVISIHVFKCELNKAQRQAEVESEVILQNNNEVGVSKF